MNILFLMDPLSTVKVDKDTTYALMLGAQRKNHQVYYLAEGGISRREGKTFFAVSELTVSEDHQKPFMVKSEQLLNESQVDALWVRTDPPFDGEYLMQTWLLDSLDPRIVVLNNPTGIRTVNEKVWASQFTSLVPPTLITRDKKQMKDFLNQYQEIIVKPTSGHGGQGIFRIKVGDHNTNVIFELLSHRFEREIILQRYVPEAVNGDKRILLLNGEVLGAVLRIHSADDHRNNFFAGGKAQPAEVTPRDLEIVSVLKPHLQKLGLYFVGIDILGDYLIEVNVTSPTCLQEMNQFSGKKLEDQVTAFVEKLVSEKR